MSMWNRVIRPIVVLCAICIVITGALAATNEVTKPIILEAIRLAEEKARTELLPEASGFTKVTGIRMNGVSDIYTADNGVGTVITCSAKGYGGPITVMVAFVEDEIHRIKITGQSETAGLGTKILKEDFWGSFSGLAAAPFEVTDINAISGATISSKAVTAAVNAAVEAYHAIP